MLHHANPGNAPRAGCILWFVCFSILGGLIFMGMKWSSEWADEMFDYDSKPNPATKVISVK